MRSIIEYSSILIPRLNNNLINQLQVTQNNALRAILNFTPINTLHESAQLEKIDSTNAVDNILLIATQILILLF
jgi:hypothetical protein